MVLCEKDKCKYFIIVKDHFEDQEFIIGYHCEEGFTIEYNDDVGYARLTPTCEKFEKSEA